MTLNDFKSMRGDAQMGIRSIPVQLGAEGAAKTACAIMAAPQVLVIALLVSWNQLIPAAIVTLFLAAQLTMMKRFVAAPVEKAIWYSGFGVPLFVFGMMASAFAVRGVI
jgi:chlorophyll/bacteriochlorophyll a synthase